MYGYLIEGKHICIHELVYHFSDVTSMLLYHFDTKENENKVFILGEYVLFPVSEFRKIYPGKKIVIYQLEQLMGCETWFKVSETIENIKGADEIWDMDELNIKYLSWHGIKVDKFVPMRYTPTLELVEHTENKDIDVLYYGFLNQRRFNIFNSMQTDFYEDINMVWLFGFNKENLNNYLARTKIVLNLHAFEPFNRQEQVRMFYAITNKMTVVSETSQSNHFPDSIIECPTEDLAKTIKTVIQTEKWKWFGKTAYKAFKEIKCIK